MDHWCGLWYKTHNQIKYNTIHHFHTLDQRNLPVYNLYYKPVARYLTITTGRYPDIAIPYHKAFSYDAKE